MHEISIHAANVKVTRWTDYRERLPIDRWGWGQRQSGEWGGEEEKLRDGQACMKGSLGDQTIVANISDSSITWLLRASKLTGLLTCFAKRLMHTHACTQTALMMTFRVIPLNSFLPFLHLPLPRVAKRTLRRLHHRALIFRNQWRIY